MTAGRPRSFAVGSMRDRMELQDSTSAVDSNGQTIRTWTTLLYKEPCNWMPTTGGEFIRGKQIEAQIRAVAVVHYRDGVYTPEQRILFDGVYYGIVHVLPVEGMRKYIQLECKAVNNGT